MQRQITVYEAAQNGKVTVLENVEATTLGELKDVLVAKGINITDMDFMEGVSNVVLRDDDSILPTNIPYKGDTTNDLFIYLSLKNKKIASGIDLMSRKELLGYIRENDLGHLVMERFGRNCTQVSTAELQRFVDEYTEEKTANPEETVETPVDVRIKTIEDAFDALLDVLHDEELLSSYQVKEIKNILHKGIEQKIKSTFEEDIEDLIHKF